MDWWQPTRFLSNDIFDVTDTILKLGKVVRGVALYESAVLLNSSCKNEVAKKKYVKSSSNLFNWAV